jgi:preprotein translocase subunit SecY
MEKAQGTIGRNSAVAGLGWLALYGAVYALGWHIPFPGLSEDVYGRWAQYDSHTIDRLSVFALGLTPFFMPLAFLELAKLALPGLARWQVASAGNMARLNDYALAATLVLAVGLSHMSDLWAASDDGSLFVLALTFVGSTALLAWLAEQITRCGRGNGFWLLWSIPSFFALRASAGRTVEMLEIGALWLPAVLIVLGFLLLSCLATAIANLVLVEGSLGADGRSGDIADALRARLMTMALIWPPLLANATFAVVLAPLLLLVPAQWRVLEYVSHGTPLHMVLSAMLILGFAYAYGRQSSALGRGLPVPFWLLASLQIAICTGGEILARTFPDVPFAVGSQWIVAITVAMVFTRPWRVQALSRRLAVDARPS